jgi:hypothetical protein
VELVALKPWPSWGLFPCSFAVTKNLGGTFQVTSWVLILKGIYSRSIHYFEFATTTSIHHQLGCSLIVETLLEWMVASTWKKCHGIMVPPRTPREEPIWLHYLGIFIQLQRNFQRRHVDAFEYLSPATDSVCSNRAPIVFLYGSVYQPWEFTWSSWFAIWRAIQITCKPRPPILCSRMAVQKWISHHIERGNTHYSWLIEWSLESEYWFCSLGNILFCYWVLVEWKIPWTVILAPRKLQLQYRSAGHECLYGPDDDDSFPYVLVLGQQCITVQPTKDTVHLQQAKNTFQASSCFIEYSSLIGCELRNWIITWPFYLVCSTSGNKAGKICDSTTVRCEGYLEKRNATLQPFSTRTIQVLLLVNWATSHHAENCGCQHLTSSTESTAPFQFLDSIAMRIYRLEFCQGKFSWDPGILALHYFFRIFTQAEATERRIAAALAYYHIHCLNHAYCIDVFCDQVHISHDHHLACVVCYLNIVKVCLYYDTHCDLSGILKHQVPWDPWDPGGSTWHWLEVKPKIKEGGMLATFPDYHHGLDLGLPLLELGLSEAPEVATTYTRELASENSAWIWTASASTA